MKHENVIDDIFGGQFQQYSKNDCGHNKHIFEPFNMFPIEINGDSLQDCLEESVKLKKLKSENYCSVCKKNVPIKRST